MALSDTAPATALQHGVGSDEPALASLTAIARTASDTAFPGAASTSTWRSFATISSGLCIRLQPMARLPRVPRLSIPQDHSYPRGATPTRRAKI
jgi:hypothetical protein